MTEPTYSLPVIETVKAAWAKLNGAKGSFWAILGLFFLALIIIGALQKLILAGLFHFISSIIQIMAGASLVYLGVRRAQDLPITYKMVKDVLTVRVILFVIGMLIIEMLIYIPAGLLTGIGVYFIHAQMGSSVIQFLVAGLCFLASFIVFIFLAARMWLAYGFIVDRKLNPWEAIVLSFKVTQGNVWNILGLFAIKVGVMILCAITLGIGLIWGLPWMLIAYGEAYKRLSSRPDIRHIH